ncbi:MAG: recombinase family protein, partial [Candidatus Moranbacteria bacterium]|nr:recombinase family protein [Candidatus Moranbacteria bacterium]
MTQYFLYARKSTDVEDKQVLSIDAQLVELRELAKDEYIEIVREFVEKKSAKMPGRAGFNDMLRRIKKGEAKGIVCWKLDRLARNPVDGGQISWMLQQGIIEHIFMPDRSYRPNDNVLMMSVEFGMANQFIRDLSSNTSRGLRQKARQGNFPGVAPVGYLNDVKTKTVVIDRRKHKAIRAAFELYSEGRSRLEDISKFLFDNGVKSTEGNPIHKDRAKFILTNPFYYGVFRYKGDLYEGRHKPIVEKRLWDKVQRVIAERSHPQKAVSDPKPLCGLMHCGECGRMITAEVQKNHTYYRCTKKNTVCSQPYVREESVVAQLSDLLSGYAFPKSWVNEFLRHMKEDERKSAQKASAFVRELREKLQNLSQNLDRLTDLYVAQDIEREDYLSRRKSMISEKRTLEEKIARLEQDALSWLEPLKEWLKDAQTLDKIALAPDLIDKKSAAMKIAGSNLFLENRKVRIVPVKPYAALCAARENLDNSDLSQIVASAV